MSRETRSGGLIEDKDKGQVSDVDKLIAEAEAAASEAERAAATEQVKVTDTKKRGSKEAAERAEKLQQGFSALKADDAFVEDFAYEWILGAYEAETGVAAPEKSTETIAALRKTGDALRKLATVDPKSPDLLKKMEDLQKMHDTLFEQVQTMTVDALDAVKKKFKGEETEFEKRYTELRESPLVRGIEHDPNTPEAREKALKHGIEEIMMRQFVEGTIAAFQKKYEERKKVLHEVQSEWDAAKGGDADYRARNLMRRFSIRYEDTNDIVDFGRWIQSEKDGLQVAEKQIMQDALVVDTNQTIIRDSLRDEHDETALRDALVDIRTYLASIREQAKSQSRFPDGKIPTLTTDIGRKIFGRYVVYGATRHGEKVGYETKNQKIPARQLSDKVPGYDLGGNGNFFFLQSQLPGASREEIIALCPLQSTVTPKIVAQMYDPRYNRNEQEARTILREKYPTPDAAVNAVFGGEGHYLNLQRAHAKVSGIEASTLSPELASAGWKESKLGALVEPGQNAREVDREYARLLERLSKPQIDAERAFDVRGPEGEFHVYTTEQAVDLLRRARRDARDIVFTSDRAVQEARVAIEGDTKGKEGLEAQVKRLNEEMAAERKKAVAREQEITERLKREGEAARKEATKLLTDDVQRISGERERLQEVRKDALVTLEAAMKKKAGLLGGDKELRAAVEQAMGQLKGK